MLEILLGILCLIFAVTAIVQYWNYYRARHLLQSGKWSVFHATYGGSTSEWHYSHKDSRYSGLSKWSLSEAYERQCELDKARRLDLPAKNDR